MTNLRQLQLRSRPAVTTSCRTDDEPAGHGASVSSEAQGANTGNEGSWPLAKALAWLVLALLALATVYTGWIALANFGRIGV